MQSLTFRLSWNVLRSQKLIKGGQRLLHYGVCFNRARYVSAVRLGNDTGGIHSRTVFPALSRCVSHEPPPDWGDIKDLPRSDPERGELVYVGPLAFLVKSVKIFSLSTSILALGLQPYLLYHTQGHSTSAVVAVGGVMGFFIFCTPLLIHFITKKYVTDIYYDSNSGVFTATTYNIFVRQKRWQFRPEDVEVPTVPGMFTSLLAKGKPLFMDQSLFKSKEAYIKMMGYDKPLDWELPEFDEQDKKKGQD